MHNIHVFNHGAQVNYTTGYIGFMDSIHLLEDDSLIYFSDPWYNQYLLASWIDHIKVNKLCTNNFILSNTDCLYRETAI